MKFIKQSPLFLLLLVSGFLLTLIAIVGKDNIYDEQEYDPLKAPLLSVVFTGINENLYPWQLLQSKEETGPMAEIESGAEDESNEPAAGSPEVTKAEPSPEASLKPSAAPSSSPAAVPTNAPDPTPVPYGEERPAPLRESTEEEYLNHISADIYGDVGILKAATYDFVTVDESYFDDALFIGDSRTVGLRDYTDLSEHADFYCETSLTIYKVMEENFKGLGTIEEALGAKDYGKIYIMVGINELGRGTTEDFMAKYTEVVDRLHELEPEAKIIIQGIMRVSGEKSESDAIFNNSNINARNRAIATLADNETIFYIDVNEVVCDEEGNLNGDYTFDQIHLLGVYDDLWKQFLLSHGIE
ncbi:MAG: GDSL-type esterase/lipase family protein [Lachnospiraceae bacterium]|nr:GDSL-type esterase/lipase family protein [Lachnospiraceae bacterium]MDD7629235.1 GDSL-type esterase/lipase family protein [Lachnospiraceae bacterium]MDY4118028.1 GDSL-type esterase/lipase family protein [Lachnospiraceae bacterium]